MSPLPFGSGSGSVRTAPLALAVAIGCFSLTPTLVRLSEVGAAATGFWRLVLALPFFYGWIALERRCGRVSTVDPSAALRLAVSGIVLGLNLVSWQVAIVATSIANAAVLGNFHPIIVAAGAALFFGERIRRRYVVGLVLSLVGVWFLTRARGSAFAGLAWGDVLAVLAGVSYGVWVLCLKGLGRVHSIAEVMTWNLSIAAAIGLGFAVALDEALLPATGWGWVDLVALAILINVIGWSLLNHTMRTLPASVNGIALLVVPVLASAWGWIVFAETVAPWQAAGGACILGGILVAQSDQWRRS
jgi:drug/metabolite transporter (DMT)-like permease